MLEKEEKKFMLPRKYHVIVKGFKSEGLTTAQIAKKLGLVKEYVDEYVQSL